MPGWYDIYPPSERILHCPGCGNNSLIEGEYLEWNKVTPDHCDLCGYMESNGTEAYPDTLDLVRKCWELQVPLYPELLNWNPA